MNILSTLFSVVTALILSINSYAQDHYCVQNNSGEAHLVTFDISTGTLTDSIGVQFANITDSVDGFTGMCQDPVSGDIYVIARDFNGTRHLSTIDPLTGSITSIDTVTVEATSMAFDASGTLYVGEGDGGNNLYTINTSDATATLFHSWSVELQNGEAIAFNTTDGLLYRYDGSAAGSFFSLNLTTLVETNIATLSGVDTYGGSLYYNVSTNDFTMAIGETFYNLKTDGTLTELSNISALGWNGYFKGIHKIDFASTDELDHSSAYSIYPNPSNGIILINTDNDFKLDVIDLSGTIVDSYSNVQSVHIKIPGAYLFRFIEENSTTVEKVIVK